MFRMASSPHVHSHSLTAKVMLWVIAAMIPAIMVANLLLWFRYLNSAVISGDFCGFTGVDRNQIAC